MSSSTLELEADAPSISVGGRLIPVAELVARDAELAGRPAPTPAYATALDPNLANRAAGILRASRLLGEPLIPWQLDAAARATQINPPGSLFYWRHQLVVIKVPRQAGKTSLLRSTLTDRALARPGCQMYSTAQSLKYSTLLWHQLTDRIKASEHLAPWVTTNASNGSETLTFLTSPARSTLRTFAPKRDGLHSQSPHVVLIDEAWSHDIDQARELMAGIRPAQITRHDRQLWIISAAGDDGSAWLDQLVEQGRASVNDPHSSMCFIEYSPAETADPYHPQTWEYHPGIGHLITLQDLAQEAQPASNTHRDFMRAFMNLSVAGGGGPIEPARWAELALADLEARPADPAAVSIGFDVALDLTGAAVVAAWQTPAGVTLEVLRTEPGLEWLTPTLTALHAAGHRLAADDDGPARVVTTALTAAGVPVATMSPATAAATWTALKARVTAGTVLHTGSPGLATDVARARENATADVTHLSRRHSRGPIDRLYAGLAAMHLASQPADTLPIS